MTYNIFAMEDFDILEFEKKFASTNQDRITFSSELTLMDSPVSRMYLNIIRCWKDIYGK